MLPRLNRRLTGLSCLILLAPLAGQAAPPAGRLLASQCAQCHGTDGRAVGDIDSLRGESAWELYEEMLEMKYGNESNDIMHYQARGYTEGQIRLIADYYASLNAGGGGTGGEGEHEEHGEEHDD
ncbi:MAG: cytochrome C [Candidatus Competibacteraceae bacterium]|nr:cytochrome C [Candidatus Competibacteraceae bacterium]MCP5127755.1 cytochrome C [Gammaproteobacteria bacterium]HRX70142.1 cytochrome C [Candidatus Competibacteraceae bacterium]